ncbi:MAG: hypothetical protein HYX54_06860 [Chloroflexi bacterium]|nr:hypothetical protein [Chloroflexota bacterium]
MRSAVGCVLLVLVMALVPLGAGASVALAATPGVSAPAAKVVFLSAITFTGTATVTPDVSRVEIVVDIEGSRRSLVADVETSVRNGTAKLTWSLETPGGYLLPNTNVTARFRLAFADGSTATGPSTTVEYEDTRYAWKTVTGDFVTVHWVDGGSSFGQRAMQIGDEAVRSVSSLLGVAEQNPIDVYVYGNRQAFYDVLGPGTRENVGGEAHPEIRTLFANIGPDAVDDPWVGVVIPHELTHLVFDSAVDNAYHYPPRWLNEGIAVNLSEGYGQSDRSAVGSAVSAGTLIPLRALAAQFPTTRERFYLAYAESVASVTFLVDRYGPDAMVKLVRSYADGVSDDETFRAALGVDVAGFEAAWLDSIGAPTPSPFGPKPAPAGPVPADWGGPAPTPGTIAGDSGAPTPATSEGPVSAPGPQASGSSIPTVIAGSFALAFVIVLMIALWARRRSTLRSATLTGAVTSEEAESSQSQDELMADEDVVDSPASVDGAADR